MTDAVFINLNRAYSPMIPIGIGILSSCLELRGFSTHIIDPKPENRNMLPDKEKMEEEILRGIKKHDPRVIGMTVYTNDVPSCIELSRRIREQNPNITIIGGGPHVTVIPFELIDYRAIDYGVIGEGERTIVEFMENVEKRNFNPRKIKGLCWKEHGKHKTSEPRPLIENLDEIPFPNYKKLPMDYYTYPTAIKLRGILLSLIEIYSSRGCPYRCSYCSSFLTFGRKPRYRSPKNVVDEIDMLKNEYKIDGFYFLDDTFTVSKSHVFGIVKELMERKIDLIWGCETRVNLVDDEKLRAMKRAGCVQIDFGVESGSQKILNTLKKDITVEQIGKAFELCKKHKIRTFANFMVNNPGETWGDVLETWKVARKIDADNMGVWVTTPYPGTELFNQFGLKDMGMEDYKMLSFGGSNRYNQKAFRNTDLFKVTRNMQGSLLGQKRIGAFFPFIMNRYYIRRVISKNALYAKAYLDGIKFSIGKRVRSYWIK